LAQLGREITLQEFAQSIAISCSATRQPAPQGSWLGAEQSWNGEYKNVDPAAGMAWIAWFPEETILANSNTACSRHCRCAKAGALCEL